MIGNGAAGHDPDVIVRANVTEDLIERPVAVSLADDSGYYSNVQSKPHHF
jgi:hypothetical protein